MPSLTNNVRFGGAFAASSANQVALLIGERGRITGEMPVDEFFKIEQKGKGRRTRWNVLHYRIVHSLEVKAKEEAENAQPFQRQAEAAVS